MKRRRGRTERERERERGRARETLCVRKKKPEARNSKYMAARTVYLQMLTCLAKIQKQSDTASSL